jgi:hypothetical protein
MSLARPRLRPSGLYVAAAGIALQDVTNAEDADRGNEKAQHLTGRDIVVELCDDRERGNDQANTLQDSAECVHGANGNTTAIGQQVLSVVA